MTKTGVARRDIFNASSNAVSVVNEALRTINKKLWRVSELDGLRLCKLLGWAEQYSVSVPYILNAILPVLAKSVERRTLKKSKGLGTTIAVLTGDVAKSILLERISKDFPAGENVYSVREDRKNEILTQLDEDANGRPKNPLQYRHAHTFTEAYKATIKRKRLEREEWEDKIAVMPYRGNPFR